jgi:hypothetical protein
MDRNKALKEMRKQKRNYNDEEEKNFVSRFVMTIGLVLVALVALYLFVGIFITKSISFGKKDKEETTEVASDKTTILASQIFDQQEDEYYVLVYDTTDEVHNIEQFLNLYKSKSGALTVYKVDSSKKFNSKYIVTEDSNKNPESINDLRIITPSLIKIRSKHVSEYIEGFEEVKNVFKR